MKNIKNSIRSWILKRKENKWSETLNEMSSILGMEKLEFINSINSLGTFDENEIDKLINVTMVFMVKMNQFNAIMGLYKDDPEMRSKLLSMF